MSSSCIDTVVRVSDGIPRPRPRPRPCGLHNQLFRRVVMLIFLLLSFPPFPFRCYGARHHPGGGYAAENHRTNLLRDIHRLAKNVHERETHEMFVNNTIRHEQALVEQNRTYRPIIMATTVLDDSLVEGFPIFFKSFLEAHDDTYALHVAALDMRGSELCERMVDERLEDKEKNRLRCYNYTSIRASIWHHAHQHHMRRSYDHWARKVKSCRRDFPGRRHAATIKEKNCQKKHMARKDWLLQMAQTSFNESRVGTSDFLSRRSHTSHADIEWLKPWHALQVWDNFTDAGLLMVDADTVFFKPFHTGAFARYNPRAPNEESLSWKERGIRARDRQQTFDELSEYLWAEAGEYTNEGACIFQPGMIYLPPTRVDVLRVWLATGTPLADGNAPDYVDTFNEWQQNVTNTSRPIAGGFDREELHFRCLSPSFFPNANTCEDNACMKLRPKAWVAWHAGGRLNHGQAGGLIEGRRVTKAVDIMDTGPFEWAKRFCKEPCKVWDVLEIDGSGPIRPPSFEEQPFNGTADCDTHKCLKRHKHERQWAIEDMLRQKMAEAQMAEEG